MSATALRMAIPRGVTSRAEVPFDEALLACMPCPSVLVRQPNRPPGKVWAIVAAESLDRWCSFHISGSPPAWEATGRRLREPAACASRDRLRRERARQLELRRTTLSRFFDGARHSRDTPLSLPLLSAIHDPRMRVALLAQWWRLRHDAVSDTEAERVILGLLLPPTALSGLVLGDDGTITHPRLEVVYRDV